MRRVAAAPVAPATKAHLVIDEVTSKVSASETKAPALFNAGEDFTQIAGSLS